ncbi:hypothetical protein SUGI_1513450 [Cryptomeria japonica]|uniref:Uncharacterized protein n=1 Tax=Cryptomeria japonica TaxID=3369 RepID=A0AAD3NST9_CRYJA|nr:hypothetical protein SUGI_1469230 [Cryptomeria japonica]GLJ58756.1 hypothetical protein SUGI_1474350 [Cryptomeria japonica]GLJ59087.1 hypothetical protein SUGI_1492250 [Cryptomeria japonica]GLJ59196.1 hypothetical protein SUGI_1497190 [Cryptomeria japonica]GLJ59292.1 hypothetical protein SUGI_1501460 [Cryptomeria japonica]
MDSEMPPSAPSSTGRVHTDKAFLFDLDCWLQKKERKQAKSVESEGQLLACVPVSCIEKGRSVAMKAKAEERGVSGKAGGSLN